MSYYDPEHSRTLARSVMHKGDPATAERIRNVVARYLPGDVLELAVQKCFFQSVGKDIRGQCRPAVDLCGREWLIALCDQSPELEADILHEIAHAHLGHGLHPGRTTEEMEDEAKAKVQEWLAADRGDS